MYVLVFFKYFEILCYIQHRDRRDRSVRGICFEGSSLFDPSSTRAMIPSVPYKSLRKAVLRIPGTVTLQYT